MRYRFFKGLLQGTTRRVLVFETPEGVFRYQMSRVAFHPLPVECLEDVAADVLGFSGAATATPIETTDEVDPHRLVMATTTATPH